jgi:hypothetical protein
MGDLPKYRVSDGQLSQSYQHRWWKTENPGAAMVQAAETLYVDAEWMRISHLAYARLFTNRLLSSLYQTSNGRGYAVPFLGTFDRRLTMNVVEACINTATAKLAKNKPRALFLTSGGDFALRRRAKLLTKFVDGLFAANDIYDDIGQAVFRDACVFGTGAVKVYTDGAEIKVERVLMHELICNEGEAVYGKPRNLYQRKYIYRERLKELYGNAENIGAIEGAQSEDPQKFGAAESDMVPCYEGWHLPDGDEPGRHVIGINGATLLSEPWSKQRFPIILFHWEDPLAGIWGKGIAEQLVGIQLEINKLLRFIQLAQRRMAIPRYLVEDGSKVNTAELSDEIGSIVKFAAGTRPPQIDTGAAVAPEIYNWFEVMYQKAFEIVGISQLSATATKPAGLNAAVALREFHDIESERFVLVGQRWEKFFLDIAGVMLDQARDLYEANPGLRVKAPGTKLIEKIAWKDVNLKEDEYEMRAYPTSILPTTPSGRLQRVQELFEAGFIDKSYAMSLMDFPDLENVVSLQTASFDEISRMIDNIIEHGKYETPEPHLDLQLATQMAQHSYLRARLDGVPDKRQELLLRWIDDCQSIIQEATPTPPPEPPPVVPGLVPAPVPPAVDLLPAPLPGTVPALASDLPASPV